MATEGVDWRIIDLPPMSAEAMLEFEKLPPDPYTGGNQRFRTFSQYKMDWMETGWSVSLLPHRPFVQPRSVNSLVGGKKRHFQPLQIDPTEQLVVGAEGLMLNPDEPWQVNVHQCRVITNDAIAGVSVPEGPHRDGHRFGMLAVWARKNITGGVTQLMETGSSVPFLETILQPGQALIYDDGAMWHNATDLEAPSQQEGHRDLWIVAFNPWSDRRYGDEFEAAATANHE